MFLLRNCLINENFVEEFVGKDVEFVEMFSELKRNDFEDSSKELNE